MQQMKQKSKLQSKYQPIAYIFVAPLILGLVTFFIHVLTVSLQFSFATVKTGDTSYELTYVLFDNYKYAFLTDTQFVRRMITSLTELVTNTPIILIFSLFIAVLLNQNMPGRTFFRAVFFLPVIVATGIIADADANNTVLQVLTNSSSIDMGTASEASFLSSESINEFFSSLNFSPTLIGYVTSAVDNIIDIIDKSGVQIIIFLAGLQSISPSIYEYAKTEGATGWDIFWKITVPLISPIMLVNLFYTVVDFTTGVNSVLSYVKNLSFTNAKFGEASAMAWIFLFAVIILLSITVGIILLIIKRNNRKEI